MWESTLSITNFGCCFQYIDGSWCDNVPEHKRTVDADGSEIWVCSEHLIEFWHRYPDGHMKNNALSECPPLRQQE